VEDLNILQKPIWKKIGFSGFGSSYAEDNTKRCTTVGCVVPSVIAGMLLLSVIFVFNYYFFQQKGAWKKLQKRQSSGYKFASSDHLPVPSTMPVQMDMPAYTSSPPVQLQVSCIDSVNVW
jgi:hypothetical protein